MGKYSAARWKVNAALGVQKVTYFLDTADKTDNSLIPNFTFDIALWRFYVRTGIYIDSERTECLSAPTV